MAVDYYSIPYELSDPFEFPLTRFLSIWEVKGNLAYRATWIQGMNVPGLFITYKGHGQISMLHGQTSVHPLTPGSFFVVDKNRPCCYECTDQGGWSFYFIHFSDVEMVKYLRIPLESTHSTPHINYLTGLCMQLVRTLIESSTGHMYLAQHWFHRILVVMAQEFDHLTGEQWQRLNPAIHWMHQNKELPLNIPALASMCHVSRTHFFRAFKRATGCTPSRYFYRLKLEAARVALKSSQMSIKEIAQSLGFSDEFHFAKSFKREYGLSPKMFRNSESSDV